MHAALGERALGGFELQFESERVDGRRSSGQLAFDLARQDTAVQESTVRRLSRVMWDGRHSSSGATTSLVSNRSLAELASTRCGACASTGISRSVVSAPAATLTSP